MISHFQVAMSPMVVQILGGIWARVSGVRTPGLKTKTGHEHEGLLPLLSYAGPLESRVRTHSGKLQTSVLELSS